MKGLYNFRALNNVAHIFRTVGVSEHILSQNNVTMAIIILVMLCFWCGVDFFSLTAEFKECSCSIILCTQIICKEECGLWMI